MNLYSPFNIEKVWCIENLWQKANVWCSPQWKGIFRSFLLLTYFVSFKSCNPDLIFVSKSIRVLKILSNGWLIVHMKWYSNLSVYFVWMSTLETLHNHHHYWLSWWQCVCPPLPIIKHSKEPCLWLHDTIRSHLKHVQ